MCCSNLYAIMDDQSAILVAAGVCFVRMFPAKNVLVKKHPAELDHPPLPIRWLMSADVQEGVVLWKWPQKPTWTLWWAKFGRGTVRQWVEHLVRMQVQVQSPASPGRAGREPCLKSFRATPSQCHLYWVKWANGLTQYNTASCVPKVTLRVAAAEI